MKLKPDIILLDKNINHPNCIKVSKYVKIFTPKTHIIIFTSNTEKERDLFYVFDIQASGYVDRQTDSGNLISIINRVLEGDSFVSPLQGRKLVQEFNEIKRNNQSKRNYYLTKRQKEVLKYLSGGPTNREITNNLFITENTVKAHITKIL